MSETFKSFLYGAGAAALCAVILSVLHYIKNKCKKLLKHDN